MILLLYRRKSNPMPSDYSSKIQPENELIGRAMVSKTYPSALKNKQTKKEINKKTPKNNNNKNSL